MGWVVWNLIVRVCGGIAQDATWCGGYDTIGQRGWDWGNWGGSSKSLPDGRELWIVSIGGGTILVTSLQELRHSLQRIRQRLALLATLKYHRRV